jgi:hypothetical protein
MAVLEPHLEDIDACIRRGFDRYGEYAPEHVADHGYRATTSCIDDHQIMLARKILDPKPGVRVIHARGLEVVNFHDRVCLRFKKVNGAGRGRNLQTDQQKRFDRQWSLPGLPPSATRVVAGYNPTVAGTEIRKVLISCPLGRTNLWCVQLVLTDEAKWVDITPSRLDGTEPFIRPEEKTGRSDARPKG